MANIRPVMATISRQFCQEEMYGVLILWKYMNLFTIDIFIIDMCYSKQYD